MPVVNHSQCYFLVMKDDDFKIFLVLSIFFFVYIAKGHRTNKLGGCDNVIILSENKRKVSILIIILWINNIEIRFFTLISIYFHTS